MEQSEQGIPESGTVDFSSAFLMTKRKEIGDAANVPRTKRKRRTEVEDVGEDGIRNGQRAKTVKNVKRTLKVKRERKAR